MKSKEKGTKYYKKMFVDYIEFTETVLTYHFLKRSGRRF
jgi:hypothetical protein